MLLNRRFLGEGRVENISILGPGQGLGCSK